MRFINGKLQITNETLHVASVDIMYTSPINVIQKMTCS